ncbi:MAG TPA: DUF3761 domain-containing protein [Solirubrobacteraceae bacterium]|jgi:hypothetical protein|nr:DUF3761 domain-containing protein [Solirubrobacteraceae bacterium]
MRGKVVAAAAVGLVALGLAGGTAQAECPYSAAPEACEAEGRPVTSLHAVLRPHHGSSYRHPGYTSLELVSTPEAAYMTASEPRTGTHVQWLTEEAEANVLEVPWSCRHPNQAFHYKLTARGHLGETVTTSVTFHAQLSARWCSATKAREEAQRLAAQHRRELEQRERERRQRERSERETRERQGREQASTCTNGTYVNSAGNTVCKPEESPSGPPAGATAECSDGTYSFSESRSGTCSSHGGVAQWL